MENGSKRKAGADSQATAKNGKRQKLSQPVTPTPPGFEIPDGWLDCPNYGHLLRPPNERCGVLPCKVPLGPKFDRYVGNNAFTPTMLLSQLRQKKLEVGLVIDLTNSWRYYDPVDFMNEGVIHMKIECRGRGECPQPEDVNKFCFEMYKFKREQALVPGPEKHIVVHCTHGFNRTGFMLVSWMVRYENMSVAKAISTFATFRTPGIYKDDYISTLFHYYHELRDSSCKTPPVPDWKQEEEKEQLELTVDDIEEAAEEDMKHDDEIGEIITEEEESTIQNIVIQLVTGKEADENNYMGSQNRRFPGSQPVSLARSNLNLLNKERYMVTWKADGTRYLMFICSWGTYLMDRTFKVKRLQMRFPLPDLKRRNHLTVLDGEMVVDEDMETGKKQRRFLAYDMPVLHGERKYVNGPFEERWKKMEQCVIAPRRNEMHQIQNNIKEGKPGKLPYRYEQELVAVRRKGFWSLPMSRNLLLNFIPNLSHECDGLILQPAALIYSTGTCKELLKWKFSHLNSVDFLLRISPSGEKQLALLETRKNRGGGVAHTVILPGAKISIPEEDAAELVDKVIECSYDRQQQIWKFMRDRRDKDTPNAFHVYESVMKSIEDNIQENDLLEAIEEALQNEVYEKDILKNK